MSFLTDEHVPRVFITTLRSNGHEVVEANEVLGEATDDEKLLRYCGEHEHVLITHDKKDFSGNLARTTEHAGIVVYTDANFLRDDPEGAAETVDRVLAYYRVEELRDQLVWLDEWRR